MKQHLHNYVFEVGNYELDQGQLNLQASLINLTQGCVYTKITSFKTISVFY